MRAHMTAKFFRRERRQPRCVVDTHNRFQRAAREVCRIDRVDGLRDERDARELAQTVGVEQKFVAQPDLAVLELDRLGAQHQVRKIDVPRMRRHVWALGHVAEVAQIALVDDLAEILLGNLVYLAFRSCIDQIEERREGAAQRHAPAATVADVENTLEFLV